MVFLVIVSSFFFPPLWSLRHLSMLACTATTDSVSLKYNLPGALVVVYSSFGEVIFWP